MENKNPIDFVRLLYVFRPGIADLRVRLFVGIMFPSTPSRKTLSVYKARLRKKGVYIPDKRKKKENV